MKDFFLRTMERERINHRLHLRPSVPPPGRDTPKPLRVAELKFVFFLVILLSVETHQSSAFLDNSALKLKWVFPKDAAFVTAPSFRPFSLGENARGLVRSRSSYSSSALGKVRGASKGHSLTDDIATVGRSTAKFSAANPDDANGSKKRIVVIRHGCTFMNEYLSKPGCRWGDANFTDVFDPETRDRYYRDSPLSPRGVRQAQRLSRRLGALLQGREGADVDLFLSEEDQNIMNEIDLIAVSPLTRALQTVELALLPHVEPAPVVQRSWSRGKYGEEISSKTASESLPRNVPIVALPFASERVYLISDVGRLPLELSQRFPYVDFESEFLDVGLKADADVMDREWWFTLDDTFDHVVDDLKSEGENEEVVEQQSPWALSTNAYVEWRPTGQGQAYAEPGEPDAWFNSRMVSLYDWLDSRPESTIALVCHWGVIQWLIDADFENCEMRVVPFESFRRSGFMLTDEEEAELFSEGEIDRERQK